MLFLLRVCFLVILMLLVAGCSSGLFRAEKASAGVQLSDVRAELPRDLVVKKVTIKKDEFEATFKTTRTSSRELRGPLDKIRIVTIFKRSSNPYPEYHLFNIWPHSPYAALGLRDGDILVAANDWVVFNSDKFKQYISLLRNEDDATIEIRRRGRPMLYKYTFVGEKKDV